ncbi:MAG: hypothetical protein AB1403_20265 [Candidatus Riflebacteria bacterium]
MRIFYSVKYSHIWLIRLNQGYRSDEEELEKFPSQALKELLAN